MCVVQPCVNASACPVLHACLTVCLQFYSHTVALISLTVIDMSKGALWNWSPVGCVLGVADCSCRASWRGIK